MQIFSFGSIETASEPPFAPLHQNYSFDTMCFVCNQFGLSAFASLALQADSTPDEAPANPDVPSPGSPGLGDSFYPNFGNGGYDAVKYTLDLNVTDVSTSTLEATTTIEAVSTQALSSFNLDFIGFEIEGITVNGQAASFSRDGQELIITPANPIANRAAFTVAVDYSGAPELVYSVAFPPETVPTGWIPFGAGNFVLSEPDGAANFYPVNDHPLDRAAYTFRVTVPEPFEVAANGVLEQTIDNGDTTTYIFEARDPMVSYLTTVNIYDGFNLEFDGVVDGIPIRNYFADDLPQELLEPFDRQPEMLAYFNEIFGPYPFELYGSVVVNTEVGGALETQTLSIFGLDLLRSPRLEEIIAHELAHQWFGNSVALADWSDIWLNESFATYSQGLWVEYSQGEAALDQWVKNQYNFIAERFDSVTPPGEPTPDSLFNRGVYDWGAVGLHALRLEIGDDDFFGTLQTYFDRFKGKKCPT
ncbi:MAG: M1 family metallopeptidase [Leptolyngbyaceae cyanobacterium SM1_3_5]|nr:M1 family metallopeptidase [Leptolyngbyaceae cyanobacterium SM1_3_5]